MRPSGKIIGRVSLPASFSGLIWSHDGKRLFAGGGFDDKIYRFDYAEGLLSRKTVFSYPGAAARGARSQRVPAGLALSKDGKTLYVANAFGHSLARFDAESGAFRDEIALEADSYPYGLALDEGHKRLYVSLWSKAKVAVVDTRDLQTAGQLATEEHPNEMLLAHGGKFLFVANANRNTVTVIDTEAGKAIETIGTAIDPKAPPGSTPNSTRALARRVTALRVQRQHQRPGRREREGPRRKRTPGLHSDGLVPDLGPAFTRRQVDLRQQRQGSELARQPRRPAARLCRRAQPDPGIHRRAVPGNAFADPHAGTAADGCLFPDGLRVQPAQARRPDRRDRSSAPTPDTRFPPRSASPRRSATSSTSSRKIEPTTRFSAT